ncbi:MAG TPA: hypothetical protein VN828_17735 [Acidobacteriaceae bacterium]|jgi:hypothetical protein|nr:hypothetical protein [Acidobacteriaceae bacterium]
MSLTLARNEVSSSSRWDLALFTVNVLGAITYVIAASRSWAIPQERGLNSTTGEPFVWALFVVPIFAVFAVVNLSWGGYICTKRRWRSGYFWLTAAAVWLVAICVDFAHH